MRLRITFAAAFAVVLGAGVGAQTISAAPPEDTYQAGPVYVGSGPGQEVYGGYCHSGPGGGGYGPGYYDGWIDASDPPGTFNDDQGRPCPTGKSPTEIPTDLLSDPPTPGGGGPQGYLKIEDPSGAVAGDGGGIVIGNTSDRGVEVGLCNKNDAVPGAKGYHAAWVSTNSGPGGRTSEGCAGDAPLVKGRDATNITSTSARLNGVVNTNRLSTKYWFEFGTTEAYGSRTSPRGLSPGHQDVPVFFDATGGTPNTTYHYRLVASNGGGTSFGPDTVFTTAAEPVP